MSRLPRQMLFELTSGLVESQSLTQFQERTESLLMKLFHADHVAFCRLHPELPTGFEWKARTLGHFLQGYYQWYQKDFVFQWLSPRPNTAFSDTEMLRGRKLEDMETHRRSRAAHLGLRHVLAVLLAPEHQRGRGAVVLYRDRPRAFLAEGRRFLQSLTPALSGAFKNFSRFGALTAHNQLLEEVLRQEGAHVIVWDAGRREYFRTEAVTALLERWFPSRSDRDEGGIPRAWKERMDVLMARRVLLSPATDSWREERERSALEVSFTRLPRIEGRDLWELRLKELQAIPETWRSVLTGRQFEAAALVVGGLSARDIANQLGISVETTKDHVQGAYRRLKVKNRAGLLALARRS